ncbi:MAG: hypothetical protein Q8P41_08940 [Pseudomonadota bacterium]|nr:hypothetical protein [Pseudomonadota bacterium]
MSDLAQDLAELIADTFAAADSWRATGAFLAPMGPLEGLPAAEPWPAGGAMRPPPTENRALPPRLEAPRRPPEAHRVVEPPRAVVTPPRPAGAPADPSRRSEPPVHRAPIEAPARTEPPRAEAPASGAGPGLAGLFGAKWQQKLRNPADEIEETLAGVARCPACGAEAASLRGAGSVESRLGVLAAGPKGLRLAGDAGVMFDRMMVHVLTLERGDVWVLEANACATEGGAGTCRSLLLRQLEIVSPKLLLTMGDAAAAIVGVPASARGDWARWRTSDVVATFHPGDLLARPGERRATMDHLTTLRQRL